MASFDIGARRLYRDHRISELDSTQLHDPCITKLALSVTIVLWSAARVPNEEDNYQVT